MLSRDLIMRVRDLTRALWIKQKCCLLITWVQWWDTTFLWDLGWTPSKLAYGSLAWPVCALHSCACWAAGPNIWPGNTGSECRVWQHASEGGDCVSQTWWHVSWRMYLEPDHVPLSFQKQRNCMRLHLKYHHPPNIVSPPWNLWLQVVQEVFDLEKLRGNHAPVSTLSVMWSAEKYSNAWLSSGVLITKRKHN